MAKNEVKIVITGDASKYTKAAKDAEKANEQIVGSVKVTAGKSSAAMSSFVGNLAALGGARLFEGVKNFLSGSLAEAEEAEKVGNATNQLVKQTGANAWTSSKQIGDLAQSLSEKVGVDDEAIQSGENVLLTFRNVRNEAGKGNDVFNRATKAGLDLSAVLGGDLTSANKILGKALNDPVKGITALGRAGVQFTDQQKAQIKTLVESGRSLDAQKIILKELEKQVGGTAEASATATEKMKVKWDNFKETLGTAVLPVVNGLLDTVGKGVEHVGSDLDALPGPLKTISTVAIGATGAAGLIGTAWGKLKSGINELPGIERLRGQFRTIGDDGEKSFTRVGKAAVVAGKVIAAAAISQGIADIINGINDMDAKGSQALDRFVASTTGSADKVVESFNHMTKIEDDMVKLQHAWTDWGARFSLGGKGPERSIEDIQSAFDKLFAAEGAQGAQTLIDSVKKLDAGLNHNSDNYKESEKIIKKWQDRVNDAKGAAKAKAQATDEDTGANKKNADSTKDQIAALDAYTKKLTGTFDPVFGAIDAATQMRDSQLKVVQATQDVAKAQKEHGRNSQEYRSALDELSRAQEDQVKAAEGEETALAALESGFKDGSVSADTMKDTLKKWVGQGKITQDQANGIIFQMGVMKAKADELNGTSVTIGLGVRADPAVAKLFNLGQTRGGRGRAEIRDTGGPVKKGQPYLIGVNRKPEWFFPESDGHVATMEQVRSTVASSVAAPPAAMRQALAPSQPAVIHFNFEAGAIVTQARSGADLLADLEKALENPTQRARILRALN